MNERIDGNRAASEITKALSLRAPQRESLDILADLLEKLELGKDADLQHWLKTIRAQYPTVEKFERDFPTLCFALATGVGKTRLMGAIVAWLFITGRSRHFFVLAPNLTIYEKLKQDFLPGSPKYVFKGIPELANNPPVLVTGEDYEDGRGVRLDIAVPPWVRDAFGLRVRPGAEARARAVTATMRWAIEHPAHEAGQQARFRASAVGGWAP